MSWGLRDVATVFEEKEGYEAYDTGCEKDVWVQTADGKPYVGMVSMCVDLMWAISFSSLFFVCK